MKAGLVLVALLAVAGCAEDPARVGTPVSNAADSVWVNGRIYTVDGERSWAEAVARINASASPSGGTSQQLSGIQVTCYFRQV